LHSIANLAAIGLERARANEATARAEAARESSELRATVLDALAHEFKTPLTSMKAASSNLLASTSGDLVADRELIAIIDEGLDRLGALVSEACSNEAVEITVRNSGSAIPDREQPRVVERFYRGAQARRIPGTGMGLAIVRQIAGAHQGTLTLASSADAGTAFTLSLPRGGRT